MKIISYRKCKKKELLPAVRLMSSTIDHLRKQTGKEPFRWRVKEVPPLITHILKTDSDTFYCAWNGEKIVGFAGAIVRGKQWYLAWLFVHPQYQDKGIGRKLLDRVWRDDRSMTHSLCTFAFNTQAVGLYSRFGMVPLCNLPWMKADPVKIKTLEPTGLKIIDTHTQADIAWLNKLESKIRGYPHPSEWQYFIKSNLHKLHLFKFRGRRVGYSLIVKNSEIAPVGAISSDYLLKVMTETLRIIKPKKDDKIMLWCPTENMRLYRFLIDIGFRVDEMDIFMSDKPYPDWQRYVPATLAML